MTPVIVMNDCAYGAEVHHLQLRRLPAAKAQFMDVDFAPIAKAYLSRLSTMEGAEHLFDEAGNLRTRRRNSAEFTRARLRRALANSSWFDHASGEILL